jgi:hypothetical protein
MFTKSKVLNMIILISDERHKELIDSPNDDSPVSDVVPISIRTLFNRLDSNITTHNTLYELLDQLSFDNEIRDCSATNLSWGREKKSDGGYSPTFGFFIELELSGSDTVLRIKPKSD